METTEPRNGQDGLSQRQMLWVVLKDIPRRNPRTNLFLLMLSVNLFGPFVRILLNPPELRMTGDLFVLFYLCPIFAPMLLLSELRPWPRSALSAYLTLPIGRRTLACGLLAASIVLFLFLESLCYAYLVATGNGSQLPPAVFLSLLVVPLSSMLVFLFMPAWLKRHELNSPYWIESTIRATAPWAFVLMSIVFWFRIARRPYDFATLPYSSMPGKIFHVLFSSDRPFVLPNLLFLLVAAVAIPFVLANVADLPWATHRKPRSSKRNESCVEYGTKRRRSVWNLLALIAAPAGQLGFLVLLVVIVLGGTGITTDETVSSLFLTLAACAVYWVSFSHLLQHLRALRTLPMRSGSLGATVLLKSALNVGLLVFIALLVMRYKHHPISLPHCLLSITVGCTIAHLAALLDGLNVGGGWIGAFVLTAFAVFLTYEIQRRMPLTPTEPVAWTWALGSTPIAVIGGLWLLTALIARSSSAYRSRESEVF